MLNKLSDTHLKFSMTNNWTNRKTIKLEIKKTVFGYMNEEYVAIYMVLSKSKMVIRVL